MIAVIDLGGHQALVQKGDKLRIDRIKTEEGKKTSFPVLMVSEPDGKNFQVGAPVIDGASAEAKVLSHEKDAKVKVFKMKPRKRYRKTYGHRSHKTEIEIVDIKTGTAKKAEPKKEAAPEKKAAPKKTAATKAPAKKAPAKKTTTKKTK